MAKNCDTEAQARLKINDMLKDAGWRLVNTEEDRRNVEVEYSSTIRKNNADAGASFDYLLTDKKGFPLCVLEAKKPAINPLSAKEQARRYAESQNIRLVILSNGEASYLWDIKLGNPQPIFNMPSQESLEARLGFSPDKKSMAGEQITPEYIALTQIPTILQEPAYLNADTKGEYILNNGLRILRPYQLDAVKSVQDAVSKGKDRFLIEMATGLGKTLTGAAIMKMFLRTGNANRILFLVDRIELERQAAKDLNKYLKNDYVTMIYKEHKADWRNAEIVVSTIQSLLAGDKYKNFAPTDFDFIISDEAHRSIGGDSRAVFEYFTGYKLGLTATPKDYLRNIDASKLDANSIKELERRVLLDTYRTFGCESGEPTYRYSLPDGVREGYLIDPTVLDIKTDITTAMLSEEGYHAIGKNEDGEEAEAIVGSKDFQKRFFNDNVNYAMCKTFLENAERDPISGEIGKTLVFCVSQKHAALIANVLNDLAMQAFPGKYESDFAVQVTSEVQNAQDMTTQFSENKLLGTSRFKDDYKTSRARVCVTVGMMTTGYDCPDLLNIAFMRPIFSPTDFVQMKGRGTRKHTFRHIDEDKNEITHEKKTFKLFDFFQNCKYFDEKFNYDAELKLPATQSLVGISNVEPKAASKPSIIIDDALDNLRSIDALPIPDGGMRIDREFWGNAQKQVSADEDIRAAIEDDNWSLAISLFKRKYENQPKLFITIDKIKKALHLDRHPSRQEILELIFGLISRIPNLQDKINDECDRIITIFQPTPEAIHAVRQFTELYISDNIFRDIIQKKEFPRLNTEYMGTFTMDDYIALGEDLQKRLPQYIVDNINLNDYME